MKTLVPLMLVSSLFITACDNSTQDKAVTQSSAASSSLVYNYQCESGETIAVTYTSTDSAKVEYKGSNFDMQIEVSASGARYVSGELEWWTKGSGSGSEATLFRHLADGTTGDIIESCREL